ncbi:MAG: ADP-ribosylglycohydrolase family protein [Candidatus Margulisbacteria bacterium]|nr:ADP-ribosylglycohydrolase family protein [Candidatus Margulisiibacteriota bacterium]
MRKTRFAKDLKFLPRTNDNNLMAIRINKPIISQPILEMRRFRGCLVGAAAGDALGAPLENLSRHDIIDTFGGSVDRYLSHARRPHLFYGSWTDDTALEQATLTSILERGNIDIKDMRSSMVGVFESEPNRGYGFSTRKALGPVQKGKGKDRPSNGAAMRMASVALFCCRDLGYLREQVEAVSRIIHRHPLAIDAAMAVAYAIALAARGELRPECLIRDTISFLGTGSEMGNKLVEVVELVEDDEMDSAEAFEQIGTSGNALESVGSAFFAFLKSPNSFYQSVVEAVNAGGDTDTIGAITGAISGAFNGIEGIPNKWLNNLEDKSIIDERSRRLFELINLT